MFPRTILTGVMAALATLLACDPGSVSSPPDGLTVSQSRSSGGTIRVTGGGEATAAPSVTFIGDDGVLRDIRSFCRSGAPISCPPGGLVNDRFTFGFTAIQHKDGTVSGQLQMVDHTLGMVLHSDVAVLVDHPVNNRPVGSEPGRPHAKRLQSSVGGVLLNGEPLAGWRLDNSPVHDGLLEAGGTADVVCFELWDLNGPTPSLVMEWIGFVSKGEVRIDGDAD